ncbi:hypothetical protein NM688_g3113 [Phlebia brevispora]|uniref:Uncharacterized protein n=1 Tax=Phlebia brevispora TaxID=194682 RepID=A0ACC1T7D2_9APHY|nr:hypothetical protein NM688_g3113 [Phlebia brevispora]
MGGFALTLGVLLVGIFFNTYLFGLVTYQFASYWRTKFNDPWPIRMMVNFLFVLDCSHSAFVIYMAWDYCVANYNNPAVLQLALWPLTFTPIATAIASFITQTFLGWRVYRLTHSYALYGFILLISLLACIFGMICGVRAMIIALSAKLVVLQHLVTAWLVFQVFADVFIAATLGLFLWRSKTGFEKTDSVVNRLIRGAIQTGIFAAAFSLGDLISFLTAPDANFYGMFAIPIGRIYTNTLLDTLLARSELRNKLNGAIDLDSTRQAPSRLRWAAATAASATVQQGSNIQLAEIEVQKDVVVFGDDGSPQDVKSSMHAV